MTGLGVFLLAVAALVPLWSSCLTFAFGVTTQPTLHALSLLAALVGSQLVARAARAPQQPRLVAVAAGGIVLVTGALDLVVLRLRGITLRAALPLAAVALPLALLAWGLALALAQAPRRDPTAAPPAPGGRERRRLPAALGALLLCAVLPLGAVEAILVQRDGAARRKGAEEAARALAQVARLHDLRSAQALIARTPMPSGARVLLRLPSGSMVPEDALLELASWPFVELPLDGALRGGAVRVHYPAAPVSVPAALPATLCLLTLALFAALFIGRRLMKDLAALTTLVEANTQASAAKPALPPLAFASSRRFSLALGRMVDKVPRLTVEAYLAVERTEDARRFKSRFLATMSHDLRSPLNSILGFSELLLRGLEGPIQPGQEVVLAAMQSSGQALLRLLNEILETAKMESGTMELQRQSSPPTELLSSAVREARRGRSTQAGERLQLEMQPGLPALSVDPLRLTQAFTHLFNAALDAASDEPIRVRAGIRDETSERFLVVDIDYQDEISGEARGQLFDGFRKIVGRPGLHLALPLARRLVELHQGILEVRPGRSPTGIALRAQIPLGPKRPSRPQKS